MTEKSLFASKNIFWMKWISVLFLLVNGITRLSVLHENGFNISVVVLSAVLLVFLTWKKPVLLRHICLLLGLSLPLYGFQSYTINNQVFELLIVLLGIIFWLRLFRNTDRQLNRDIVGLLSCYVLLALISLLLLPVSSFFRLFSLWGFLDFSSAILTAIPENPLYSLAAFNRLILFFLVVFLGSKQNDAREVYRKICIGAVLACVLIVIMGILNQYGLIELAKFRPQFFDPSGVSRLHSVMGNPGWFAEYIVVCSPFILLVFPARWHISLRLAGMTLFFLVCVVALVLTGSRTSWLIYPLIIFSCYMHVFFLRDQRCGNGSRSLVFCNGTAIGFVLVCAFILGSATILIKLDSGNTKTGNMTRIQYVIDRLRHITTPGERIKVWQESLILGSESPVFGMGYGSYKWHQTVMGSLPRSQFAKNRKTVNNWDTPHNFYIQLYISNGIVGMFVCLFLVGLTGMLLFCDVFQKKQPFTWALLTSLAGFLSYGLTQDIQYISMIWFLLFLIIGYAMTLDNSILPARLRNIHSYVMLVCLVVLLSGGVVYACNFESRLLARKYDMHNYSIGGHLPLCIGFYKKEDWGPKGIFCWSGPQAEMRVRDRGVVEVDFACNAPGLESNPIVFDVLLADRVIDRYTFWGARTIKRQYWIPGKGGDLKSKLIFRVSRTWNPRLSGMGSDTRNLGVAVSEPKFSQQFPSEDLGFYDWQASRDEDREKGHRLLKYRWTRQEAVLDLSHYKKNSMAFVLKSDQPYIEKYPVNIEFLQQGSVIDSLVLHDHLWKQFSLPRLVNFDRPLTIRVNRTWNPRREGYSDDPRDLGVAVALVPADVGKEVSVTSKAAMMRQDTLSGGWPTQ